MKKNIHPEYKDVVFLDMSTGKKFLCRSTVKTNETIDFEGNTYPLVKVSISSASHPFYTGSQDFVDTEGRVDKFKKRYEKKAQEVQEAKEKAKIAEQEALKTKKRVKKKS